MTLAEQLLHFDRKAEQAFVKSLKEMKSRREDIIAAARERIIAGYDLYGAEGYRWDYHKLRDARLEEYADAVNYQLMSAFQGWE